MNGNGQVARRLGRLEALAPGDVVAWFEKAQPILEAMAASDDDHRDAAGGWWDLQRQLFALGPRTWPEVDRAFDAYIQLLEARG